MECLGDQFTKGVILAGRFKTISPLNHGSFGMVFMAEDLENNEIVAIKCLMKRNPIPEVDSPYTIDDNSEELKFHAHLGNHPNIVNLIHSFETESSIFLILEFCSRGDLYEAIRAGTGPLQTEHVRQFMLQLVNAVDYMHQKGIYHRDIKPENIFIAHSGEMKLGDFGLATTQEWTYEVMVGSDRYMAPEQFDSAGAGYSPEKADIWAVGICLLNVLFSRNPFTTPTESDPLFLDFSRDMQSLFDVFPTMSQDTFEVILQCMSLDPRKRSLDGVRKALERLVSFTTADETYDDFLLAERRGIAASANREPIRTPSIQSPQIELSSFHWTKALHSTLPSQGHQASGILDDESYTEELFPKSDEENNDWFSDGQQSPSVKSILDSNYETLTESLAIRAPRKIDSSKGSAVPQSTSLPTFFLSKTGSNDAISKSWSDLWEEEEQEEAENKIRNSHIKASRAWSKECGVNGRVSSFDPIRHAGNEEFCSHNSTDRDFQEKSIDIDSDLVADGFFFHNISRENTAKKPESHFLPSPERTSIDKWSALGERRRAYTGPSSSEPDFTPFRGRKEMRIPQDTLAGSVNPAWGSKEKLIKEMGHKTKGKGCPWVRERVWNHQNFKGKCQVDSGDLEWVGGWKEPQL
ncbi:Serine/threonine-protein kinase polo [Erysiphe neolycopersici]|uniref:non-specific serine/threonine protein kinase n=1 Tax=Erysiphe neolycopersici TaxID=212602 RepID=A0A420HIM2_9PEZI|nr:Serine/threonine-protein kinase polo [Erysiphe neolycopersici]